MCAGAEEQKEGRRKGADQPSVLHRQLGGWALMAHSHLSVDQAKQWMERKNPRNGRLSDPEDPKNQGEPQTPSLTVDKSVSRSLRGGLYLFSKFGEDGSDLLFIAEVSLTARASPVQRGRSRLPSTASGFRSVPEPREVFLPIRISAEGNHRLMRCNSSELESRVMV